MKRIVFTKVNTAELLDFEIAAPSAGEVQVELVMSSVSSGTERANITGDPYVSVVATVPDTTFPRSGGYSSAGVITGVGADAEGFSVGDPVALSWSTHSQKQNISAKLVHKLEGVSFSDGALMHIATFPLAAIRSSDFTIDYYRKVHGPGITLIGAHTMARPIRDSSDGWWTEWDDFEALLKLTRLGRIRLSDLVEEIHSPEEAPAVYERLCAEKTFPLVQFDWRRLK